MNCRYGKENKNKTNNSCANCKGQSHLTCTHTHIHTVAPSYVGVQASHTKGASVRFWQWGQVPQLHGGLPHSAGGCIVQGTLCAIVGVQHWLCHYMPTVVSLHADGGVTTRRWLCHQVLMVVSPKTAVLIMVSSAPAAQWSGRAHTEGPTPPRKLA